MPAHYARSRPRRLASHSGASRPGGPSLGISGSTLTEVVTMERSLKRALVPLASAAHSRQVDLVCEVSPDVGEYVLGDRRQFMDLVARVAAEGIAASRGGEVCVRVARQRAGFASSNTVLVSVSVRRSDGIEDIAFLETVLPVAERFDDVEEDLELVGTRVLIVVPTIHAARVHSLAARQFGALVESVVSAQAAHDRIREANNTGTPFDVMYIDDKAPHVGDLLRASREDASLGRARTILGTALAESPAQAAYEASAAMIVSKPVLPRELRDSIVQIRDESNAGVVCSTDSEAPRESEVRPKGSAVHRRLQLAGVLASLAVSPSRPPR